MKLFLLAGFLGLSYGQETCASIQIMCNSTVGTPCDKHPNMATHTIMQCQSPLVCLTSNLTCQNKPTAGTPCTMDDDCRWTLGDNPLAQMRCNSTSMQCYLPMNDAPAPTQGCRTNGDPCMANEDCAFGNCVGGMCEGLREQAWCNGTAFRFCGHGLYCNGNLTNSSAPGQCVQLMNDGATPHPDWGEASCKGGAEMGGVCATPNWRSVAAGGACYYAELREQRADELCQIGLRCDPNNSTCVSDMAFPNPCNISMDDGCEGPERDQNRGACHCQTTNSNPVCLRSTCPWGYGDYTRRLSWCGFIPLQNYGRCPTGGTYNQTWKDSCAQRALLCAQTKNYQCSSNWAVSEYRKVLLSSSASTVCGHPISYPVTLPSYCSTATRIHPVMSIFVVILLMLLR